MANRVLVELSYNKKVLIDVEQLPALMAILDGAPIVDYDFVEDGRVNYLHDKGYALEFSHAPVCHYHTEAEIATMKEAEAQRKEVPAEDAA